MRKLTTSRMETNNFVLITFRTGSAGLINTIQMYARGHIAAGIVSTFALVGWVVQGGGNAFYYRLVCLFFLWFLPYLALMSVI